MKRNSIDVAEADPWTGVPERLAQLLAEKPYDVVHPLETDYLGKTTAIIFQQAGDERGGYALVVGDLSPEPLIRIQSRCTYGEVFRSRHCDCRQQLEHAGELIRSAGNGVLIYLDQEGRDAGIMMKARAYRAFAEDGVDTFTYYEQQGLAADPRSYAQVVTLLRDLGLGSVRLLTNNPAKISALEASGFCVVRVPLVVETDRLSEPYLAAKRERGHLL